MGTNGNKVYIRGLRDVAAAETRISFVHPMGSLYYAGYNIDDLVGHVCYEEVVHLLLNDKLPNAKELEQIKADLRAEMNLPTAVQDSIQCTPPQAHPMDVLRTEVSHLASYDPERDNETEEANKKRALRLIAKVPTIVAAFNRTRNQKEIMDPKPDYGFSENFLYLFRGKCCTPEEKDAMERYLILHADHGLNASTFAARVTASTFSDMYSAVTSAVGTLKGRLHGGASEKVMHMLSEAPCLEEVEEYIRGMIFDRKRIMGFGHRIYTAEDPRSRHLKKIGKALCEREDRMELYQKCKKIQATVHREKKIYPNVDFYAALVLHALGVQKEFFTPFFAASRTAGWSAHILEQYSEAVLIRPTSNYTGIYGKPFTPIEKRK
ncbi:MAG: citrate synthase [Candidatus Bathyarchaeota archaeon]|nr:citrate synthase [Candidatus Bathyarchaeota archaeon]